MCMRKQEKQQQMSKKNIKKHVHFVEVEKRLIFIATPFCCSPRTQKIKTRKLLFQRYKN